MRWQWYKQCHENLTYGTVSLFQFGNSPETNHNWSAIMKLTFGIKGYTLCLPWPRLKDLYTVAPYCFLSLSLSLSLCVCLSLSFGNMNQPPRICPWLPNHAWLSIFLHNGIRIYELVSISDTFIPLNTVTIQPIEICRKSCKRIALVTDHSFSYCLPVFPAARNPSWSIVIPLHRKRFTSLLSHIAVYDSLFGLIAHPCHNKQNTGNQLSKLNKSKYIYVIHLNYNIFRGTINNFQTFIMVSHQMFIITGNSKKPQTSHSSVTAKGASI